MHVLTSKSYVFMHFPDVNAWICVNVKQDVTPKDHLCSIRLRMNVFQSVF